MQAFASLRAAQTKVEILRKVNVLQKVTLDASCSRKENICASRSFATGMKVNQECLKEMKYSWQVRFTYIDQSTYTKMQME